MAYAYVDYEDKRDAEDAIKYENGRVLRGQTIIVEWCRGPSSRPPMRSRISAECYRCHRHGHWVRDCPELERDRYKARCYSRSRSHSKRHSRYSYSRSRSTSRGQYGRRRRTPSQVRPPSYNRSRRPRIPCPASSHSGPRYSYSRSRRTSRGQYGRRRRTPSQVRPPSYNRSRRPRIPSPASSHSGPSIIFLKRITPTVVLKPIRMSETRKKPCFTTVSEANPSEIKGVKYGLRRQN